MSTPIRQLIKSKIKSPISPSVGCNKIATNRYENRLRVKSNSSQNFAKSLNFETAFHNASKNINLPFKDDFKSGFDRNNNITFEVTDYSQDILLINSPNKSKGSFGIVLRGIHQGNDVAVKVVKLSKNGSFLRESNALHLKHKNVVKVIEVVYNSNASYGIVLMEYLKSFRHLQSILDDQNIVFNQEIIIKYAIDVCEGLKYCHENGVLHLDIKPSNILVNQYGTCKLCDFGNSVKLDRTDEWKGQHATVAYAAPELLLGKLPTTQCDVYSLGILLWQMQYREIPYLEIDSMETIIYK
ncbi:hypothetical protein ILUMI_18516, partial [Ignelater luminosus]